jgi:hypothetical protein
LTPVTELAYPSSMREVDKDAMKLIAAMFVAGIVAVAVVLCVLWLIGAQLP